MDLSLSENQEMLRASARSFMEREASRDFVVAMQQADSSLAADVWRKAAALGWLGMLVPEEYGGIASSLADTAVLYEELRRRPAFPHDECPEHPRAEERPGQRRR